MVVTLSKSTQRQGLYAPGGACDRVILSGVFWLAYMFKYRIYVIHRYRHGIYIKIYIYIYTYEHCAYTGFTRDI